MWDQSLGAEVSKKSSQLSKERRSDLNSIRFLAEAALLERNTHAAKEQAKLLLNRDIKNDSAIKIQVKAALLEKKPHAALLLSDNALDISPQDAEIYSLKGLAHAQMGNSIIAKAMWTKALGLDPLNISALMNLGVLFFNSGHVNKAGAHFDKVLAIVPRHQDALLGKALVQSAQGEPQKALVALEAISKEFSTNAVVLENIANVAKEHLKDYRLAMKYVEKILALKRTDRNSLESAVALKQELKKRLAAEETQLSDESLREMAETSSSQSTLTSGQALSQMSLDDSNDISRLEESIK
jgi:tetratricopeptide (TPR) repeat protein